MLGISQERDLSLQSQSEMTIYSVADLYLIQSLETQSTLGNRPFNTELRDTQNA